MAAKLFYTMAYGAYEYMTKGVVNIGHCWLVVISCA